MKYKFANVFVSYAWDNEDAVILILNKLVKCGIKIQIDRTITRKKGGLDLFEELEKVMETEESPCAIIFISLKSIESKAVLRELIKLLDLRSRGARIIPILLEKYDDLKLPMEWRTLLEDDQGNRKILYFRKNANLINNLVKSIFNHFQIDKSHEVVFHAGHRMPYTSILDLPTEWCDFPVLDFRLEINHDGDYLFSPIQTQWNEIIRCLEIVKNALDNMRLILLLGKSPVGFAACIANPWGRGSLSDVKVWNESANEVWETKYQPPDDLESKLVMQINNCRNGSTQNNVFIGFQDNILEEISDLTDPKSNLVWLKTKRIINSAMIHDICNQIIKFLEMNSTHYIEQNLYFGLPFGLVGLVCWNIKSVGNVNIYEYRKNRIPSYLKVVTLK